MVYGHTFVAAESPNSVLIFAEQRSQRVLLKIAPRLIQGGEAPKIHRAGQL